MGVRSAEGWDHLPFAVWFQTPRDCQSEWGTPVGGRIRVRVLPGPRALQRGLCAGSWRGDTSGAQLGFLPPRGSRMRRVHWRKGLKSNFAKCGRENPGSGTEWQLHPRRRGLGCGAENSASWII